MLPSRFDGGTLIALALREVLSCTTRTPGRIDGCVLLVAAGRRPTSTDGSAFALREVVIVTTCPAGRRERAEVAMKTAGRLQSTVARGACGENGFDEIDIFPQKATDPARYTHSYAPCPSSSASTRDLNSGFFFTVTSSSGSGSINGTLCAGSPYSRVTMPPRS